MRGAVAFNSPHSGSVYPREFLAASRIDLAALRRSEDCFVDELIAGVVRARLPVGAGAFPALLCRRQPRALRARSAHVRRAAAELCQYPLDAGRRRPRHHPARGRRRPGDLSQRIPSTTRLRRIEALYKPYHRALRRLINKAIAISALRCWWIAIRCRRSASRGTKPRRRRGDRRPLRHELRGSLPDMVEETMRALGYSVGRNKPYAGGFITEHYGNPAAGCIPSSSSSTARSTWTSGGASAPPRFAQVAAISRRWPTRWPPSRSANSAVSGRRRVSATCRPDSATLHRMPLPLLGTAEDFEPPA